MQREQGEGEGEGVGGRRVARVDQSHGLVAHRAVVELGLVPVDGVHEHPEDVLRLGLCPTRGDHAVDEPVEGGQRGLEVGIRAGRPRRVDGPRVKASFRAWLKRSIVSIAPERSPENIVSARIASVSSDISAWRSIMSPSRHPASFRVTWRAKISPNPLTLR